MTHARDNGGDLAGAVRATRADIERDARRAAAAAGERAADLHETLDTLGLAPKPSGKAAKTSPVPVRAQAPATPLPDNTAINQPFDRDRSDWIVEKVNDSFSPAHMQEQKQFAVPAGTSGTFQVSSVFARDMAGTQPIRLNGATLPGTGGEGGTVDERLESLCTALRDGADLSNDEILLLSRVMNQSTGLTIMMQFHEAPDLAPSLKLSDGNEVPLLVHIGQGQWSVETTDTGVDLTYTSDGDIGGQTAMMRQGTDFTFGEGSTIRTVCTFVLDRSGGDLAIRGMRDSAITLTAFDRDERQLV